MDERVEETAKAKKQETCTVGILVFDGVEILDFTGPFEVFSALWSDPDEQTKESHPLFRVVTIAGNDQVITCFGGLQVKPHATISNHPPLDILLVPGGHVTDVIANPRLLEWIIQQDQHTKLTTSVCTGALVLAKCGLLSGHRATTHWTAIELMRERHPDIEVLSEARFVDEGHIITSAGISAGIDMSLHVVSRLFGEEAAAMTARGMEYESVARAS
jgi:transcriptional regulator GlxA family with amidase domain